MAGNGIYSFVKNLFSRNIKQEILSVMKKEYESEGEDEEMDCWMEDQENKENNPGYMNEVVKCTDNGEGQNKKTKAQVDSLDLPMALRLRKSVRMKAIHQPAEQKHQFLENFLDYVNVKIPGQKKSIKFPLNLKGYRYHLAEYDAKKLIHDSYEDNPNLYTRPIPSHMYHVILPEKVTLSPSDRDRMLTLDKECMSITGFAGYSNARATHSVFHGSWYYEVIFQEQPANSHVRIGWTQRFELLRVPVGFSKYSYSWRSKYGTKFHESRGKKYCPGGYKQGDVLGCLIELPTMDELIKQGFSPSDLLPSTKKDCNLIVYNKLFYFEENQATSSTDRRFKNGQENLRPITGSKISFFLNGHPAGVAFSDVYFGEYFPAISIYGRSTLRCNFGPTFKCPPKIEGRNFSPMSERAEHIQTEQCLSETIYTVSNMDKLIEKEKEWYLGNSDDDEHHSNKAEWNQTNQRRQRGIIQI